MRKLNDIIVVCRTSICNQILCNWIDLRNSAFNTRVRTCAEASRTWSEWQTICPPLSSQKHAVDRFDCNIFIVLFILNLRLCISVIWYQHRFVIKLLVDLEQLVLRAHILYLVGCARSGSRKETASFEMLRNGYN